MMANDEESLIRLRAKMSEKERQEMAEIIGAELRRRNEEKVEMKQGTSTGGNAKSSVRNSPLSSGLDQDSLRELYAETASKVKNARMRKLDQAFEQTRALQRNQAIGQGSRERTLPRIPRVFSGSLPFGKTALFAGILILSGVKILFATGVVSAASSPRSAIEREVKPVAAQLLERPDAIAVGGTKERSAAQGTWSSEEKELLGQLDARRVELEKRREILDRREAEIRAQSEGLAERLAELRTLTAKLSETRENLDHRYEERMEQLATVYGAMQPKEAAPLIGKLEDSIAIGLLERLPSKRLGQILSMMDSERAISLTKKLSDRKQIN